MKMRVLIAVAIAVLVIVIVGASSCNSSRSRQELILSLTAYYSPDRCQEIGSRARLEHAADRSHQAAFRLSHDDGCLIPHLSSTCIFSSFSFALVPFTVCASRILWSLVVDRPDLQIATAHRPPPPLDHAPRSFPPSFSSPPAGLFEPCTHSASASAHQCRLASPFHAHLALALTAPPLVPSRFPFPVQFFRPSYISFLPVSLLAKQYFFSILLACRPCPDSLFIWK